jgi:hypothetical protein
LDCFSVFGLVHVRMLAALLLELHEGAADFNPLELSESFVLGVYLFIFLLLLFVSCAGQLEVEPLGVAGEEGGREVGNEVLFRNGREDRELLGLAVEDILVGAQLCPVSPLLLS